MSQNNSLSKEEIESLDTKDLVQCTRSELGIGDTLLNRGDTSCPSWTAQLILEVLRRLEFVVDSNKCLEQDNQNLRKGLVGQCHCKHYKGMHENDYADCLVVCSLHDDDYVSISACQTCPDCELEMKDGQTNA